MVNITNYKTYNPLGPLNQEGCITYAISEPQSSHEKKICRMIDQCCSHYRVHEGPGEVEQLLQTGRDEGDMTTKCTVGLYMQSWNRKIN